jgi:drug/metabolite transporter (DMT)-like permease
MSRDERPTVVGALILVQVFFGLSYLASKVLLDFIPPRAWAVVRVISAALILLAAVRLLRRKIPTAPRDLGLLAVFSIFGVVINQVLFVEGLARTTPAHSSIIMTSIPVGTLLFGVLLKRESINRWKILSLAVSFAGVMLVILSGPGGIAAAESGLMAPNPVLGDVLTLLNALSYAFFLVISKRLLTRTDPLGATAVLMCFGAIGIAAIGTPALVAAPLSGVPLHVWGLGLYIVVFPTALAYVLMYWALKKTGSYVVALFIYLQPLIASALSAVLLGERIGLPIIAGGALIFVGVYLALQSSGAPRT